MDERQGKIRNGDQIRNDYTLRRDFFSFKCYLKKNIIKIQLFKK